LECSGRVGNDFAGIAVIGPILRQYPNEPMAAARCVQHGEFRLAHRLCRKDPQASAIARKYFLSQQLRASWGEDHHPNGG